MAASDRGGGPPRLGIFEALGGDAGVPTVTDVHDGAVRLFSYGGATTYAGSRSEPSNAPATSEGAGRGLPSLTPLYDLYDALCAERSRP